MLEWERRLLRYSLTSDRRRGSSRWIKLEEDKKRCRDTRKDITWQTLRMACVPVGAKGLCKICRVSNLPVIHIFTHAADGSGKRLSSRILGIINKPDSIRLLKLEDQEDLKALWLLYKINFTI